VTLARPGRVWAAAGRPGEQRHGDKPVAAAQGQGAGQCHLRERLESWKIFSKRAVWGGGHRPSCGLATVKVVKMMNSLTPGA